MEALWNITGTTREQYRGSRRATRVPYRINRRAVPAARRASSLVLHFGFVSVPGFPYLRLRMCPPTQMPQNMKPTTDLTRRAFIKLGATAAAAGLADCSGPTARTAQPAGSKAGPAAVSGADAFNYILGTQSIGATYQFTDQTLMVETAQAILDLGSNVLKITLGRDYRRMVLKPSKTAYPETMQYVLNQGSDARTSLRIKFPGAAIEPPPEDPAIQSLADLARLEPSYRKVFAMPFAYYVVWTYSFAPRWWNKRFPAAEQEKEYREFYALTAHLLKTYNGTGKTFFLGHWEGDWHLRPDLNTKTDDGVPPESLQGMTDWLNTRQRAVDHAKRRTPPRRRGVPPLRAHFAARVGPAALGRKIARDTHEAQPGELADGSYTVVVPPCPKQPPENHVAWPNSPAGCQTRFPRATIQAVALSSPTILKGLWNPARG